MLYIDSSAKSRAFLIVLTYYHHMEKYAKYWVIETLKIGLLREWGGGDTNIIIELFPS